jgi:tRNA threonylcarbamoyladenosine biosynthesis protein TsaE
LAICNLDTYITKNANQTRKLGEILAQELKGGELICLFGDLGSGKTTFAQGVLRGLGAKGHYTSPTFVVMKHYKKIKNQKSKIKNSDKNSKKGEGIQDIYHIDCYRVKSQDILSLGWEEIVAGKHNIAIVEWAERIKKIIPKNAVWLKFKHKREDEREIKIIGN